MAVAAPKRRSQSQAAPAPSRTAPPEPKKRPRDRPRPGGAGRSAAAPATKPARKSGAPKRKGAPTRKSAGTKGAAKATAAPARRKAAPRRRSPAGVIPIAAGHAGRAAVAVTQLPESGLIHRLTRGRAWIGVLGVLLVGIVALNVVTLSFAASAGKVDERNTELSEENSALQSRMAQKYGQAKLHHEAAQLGLSSQAATEAQIIEARSTDVAEAAARLAAAAAGTAAASGEASGSEAASSGAEAGSEETAGSEGASTGESPSEAEIAEMSQAEKNAIYEETLANEAYAAEVAATETVTEVPAG